MTNPKRFHNTDSSLAAGAAYFPTQPQAPLASQPPHNQILGSAQSCPVQPFQYDDVSIDQLLQQSGMILKTSYDQLTIG